MQQFPKTRFFRKFSASDWNHPESHPSVSLIVGPQPERASILSSNAEKLRKMGSRKIKEN